jgi:hypothetical protein
MTTQTAAPEPATELPPAEITALAARYEAFGYDTPDDRLFALLCDVARMYAAGNRSEGIPLRITLDSLLESVADNIAPED